MKILISVTLSIFFSTFVYSQEGTDTVNFQVNDIKLDLLKAPTNPAFLLMNTSPAEIVEPGSLPEFYATVQNASDNLSAFPNNYGFSVTPYWWGKKARHLSFSEDYDTVNAFTFYRTLGISAGVVKGVAENEDLWRYGLGFQTTLLRGRVDKAKKSAYMDQLWQYHHQYYKDINAFLKMNPDYNKLEAESNYLLLQYKVLDSLSNAGAIDPALAAQQKAELLKKYQLAQDRLKSLQEILSARFNDENRYLESNAELDRKFNEMDDRKGLKWDLGGGISFDAEKNKIDSLGVYRMGLWSNIGGSLISPDSSRSSFSGFLMMRYLYYKEVYYLDGDRAGIMKNLQTLDLGAKIQYEIAGKFILGFEAIYRTALTGSEYESTYKINGLAQYQFARNKLVYISLGNNFNDHSSGGPEDLIFTFGINLGFGGEIDLYDLNLK
jgi:hypothetical protein